MKKKLVIKILLWLLPLLKDRFMSENIDGVIKNKVLKEIKGIYSNVKVNINSDDNIYSKIYVLNFNDGSHFSFKLDFTKNGVKFYFMETNIIDLFKLSNIISSIKWKLEMYTTEIEAYFYLNLKKTVQNLKDYQYYNRS